LLFLAEESRHFSIDLIVALLPGHSSETTPMDFAVFPYIKFFLRGMRFDKWIKTSRNECNISNENWSVCANFWL
jgi:hypothetical protein